MISVYIVRHSLMVGKPRFKGGSGNAEKRLWHDMWTKLLLPKMEPVDNFVNTVMNFRILETTAISLRV